MTDKEIQEKKKEFLDRLDEHSRVYEVSIHSDSEEEINQILTEADNDLWSWIEKLVEEVEGEAKKQLLKDFRFPYDDDLTPEENCKNGFILLHRKIKVINELYGTED